MIVINAQDQILGRICTVIAKKALLGEQVIVVNCEKAVLSGDRDVLLAKYFSKWKKGIPQQGPYVSRQPEKLLRRTVRGMLPWKFQKGRDAFKRVTCFVGMPHEYQNVQFLAIENAGRKKVINVSTHYLGDICKLIGAKS